MFNQAFISDLFPFDWKKASIVPIHKVGYKKTLKDDSFQFPGSLFMFKSLKDLILTNV